MKYMAKIEIPEGNDFLTESVIEAEIKSAFYAFYGIKVDVEVYVPRGELKELREAEREAPAYPPKQFNANANVWLG